MARLVQRCVALTVLLAASRVDAAELVAHWRMDDVKDGALADASGKGHDGRA